VSLPLFNQGAKRLQHSLAHTRLQKTALLKTVVPGSQDSSIAPRHPSDFSLVGIWLVETTGPAELRQLFIIQLHKHCNAVETNRRVSRFFAGEMLATGHVIATDSDSLPWLRRRAFQERDQRIKLGFLFSQRTRNRSRLQIQHQGSGSECPLADCRFSVQWRLWA